MTTARIGQRARLGTAYLALLSLAACGGGGGGTGTPAAQTGLVTTAGPTPVAQAPAGPTPMGTLSFTITVPNTSTTTAGRTVKYVSPSTQSITISLKGQTTALATVNLSAGTPGCSASTNGTACTISANVPAGNDLFVITAFDQTNGAGRQLSTADVPATITASATTRVPLTLNGTVASVAVILGSSSVQVGTPASVAVTVVAYDSSNNVIVGPGNFSTPVVLTDADASGATSLSTTTVAAPGTSVSLKYNGNSMTVATITPAISGGPSGTAATFTPTGNAYANYLMPQPVDEIAAIAPGPGGNTWFTAFGNQSAVGTVGYVTPQGATTVFTASVPQTYIMGLAMGGDGNLYFGDDNGEIGTISSSGAVNYATTFNICGSSTCGGVNAMTLGPDGNVWFADDNGYIGVVLPNLNVMEYDVTGLTGWPGGGSEPKHLQFYNGQLYVSDEYGYVDQISVSGSVPQSVVQVPYLIGCGCGFGGYALTVDNHGNVWFSDGCSNIGTVPAANFSQSAMLMWSASTIIGNNSFGYMQATPGGIFATDNTTGSLYAIVNVSSLTQGQPPNFEVMAAFPNSGAAANVLAIGSDGNLWTATDNTSGQNPNIPPGLSKVIYSAPGGVPLASLRRAAASLSKAKTGRYFPSGRVHRKQRHAAFIIRSKAAAAARGHAK